ncbi:protein FAR1-RELATED SEQUENCE 6-like [Syzygium oleosum]|uniref:protein FAR1-RELATED SEQUENCE 6-like n=1 Tax=Syzygium oleosum TaxID=219896 RepID=UPI0011D1B61F|nr:protein FAR1-RELATED SEQUENCE 6-like [Syzygium oleosum]
MEVDSNATRGEEGLILGGKRNDDAGDDENVEKNEFKEPSTDVDVEVPRIGINFASQQETRCYYEKYASQKGFGVRKISTKRNIDGQSSYYSLACVKGGKQKSTAKSRFISRLSIKTDCKAKINVIVDGDGQCTISRVLLDHNHALSPKISRFQRSRRKLDSYSKRRVELNDLASIPLDKNSHSVASEVGESENLAFGEKDCGNYIAEVEQLKLTIGDAEALCNYFVRMQRRNSNFFYVIDMDEEGRLRNVFWADARSRAAYESFGDVLFFDTTYLTNKYDMSLTTFVGVNHHGQPILYGCGLLSREDVGAYDWLFRSWLECMHGRPPNAIITDQCKMIQAAVAEVFPSSRHRLCLWHIMKKLPEKLGGLAQYKAIEKILKGAVYESLNPQEFEESWSKMIEEFNFEKNEWLSSLFVDSHRWVPIYVKKVFWAGLSTTQRNESMDAFLDDYVSSKTSLKQFVEQYDSALKSKVDRENKADYCSSNST